MGFKTFQVHGAGECTSAAALFGAPGNAVEIE